MVAASLTFAFGDVRGQRLCDDAVLLGDERDVKRPYVLLDAVMCFSLVKPRDTCMSGMDAIVFRRFVRTVGR